jgi:hypothetical protein
MTPEQTPPDDDVLREVEEAEAATAAILRSKRPVPAPAFRGNLRRSLAESQPGGAGLTVKASVGTQIVGLLGAGALLLLVAAIGLAGIGPFGA